MVINGIIIAVSVVLFAYWFRYACLLMLASKEDRGYVRRVANANQLRFESAQESLSVAASNSRSLRDVSASLDRDFKVLTYLMRNVARSEQNVRRLEQRLLVWDYRLVMLWYSVVSRISNSLARTALREIASILSHIANSVGEQMAPTSRP